MRCSAVGLGFLCIVACDNGAGPRDTPDAGGVGPIHAAEITMFSADRVMLDRPGSVRLQWTTEHAQSVRLTREGVVLLEVGVPNASWPIEEVSSTTTFTLEAQGEAGRDVATLRVQVRPASALPEIERFEAYPEQFDGISAEVGLGWKARGELRLYANDIELPDFPGQEASFWQTRVDRATRFVLTASAAGEVVEKTVLVRRSGRELEPNDDRGTAGYLDRDGLARGTITSRDVDWYGFDVPAGGAVFAQLSDGSRGCGFDSQMELWGPDPERPGQLRFIALADDDGDRLCALMDPAQMAELLELQEGRHYLSVRGFDASAVGDYELEVRVTEPGCGNGLVEAGAGEHCEPSVLGALCGADCRLIPTSTLAGPDVVVRAWVGPGPTALRLQVDEPAVVGFEVDACGRELALFELGRSGGAMPLELGRAVCALDARLLEAGDYLLVTEGEQRESLLASVRRRGCGDGWVEAPEGCDPLGGQWDGCSASCDYLDFGAGPGEHALSLARTEPHFVRVEVLQPGSTITATLSGPTSGLALGLYDESFYPLVFLEPGEAMQGSKTRDLPAGVYHVGVTRTARGPAIDTTLRVGLEPPRCGDGFVQVVAGEQCDDGPVPLSGCNQSCRFVLVGPEVMVGEQITSVQGTVPGEGRLVVAVRTGTVAHMWAQMSTSTERIVCDAPADSDLQVQLYGPDLALRVEAGPTGIQGYCPGFSFANTGSGRHYLVLETLSNRPLELGQIRTWQRPARCGDGIVAFDEECDDANSNIGDGCHQCRLEGPVTFESEPNDSPPWADDLPVRQAEGVFRAIGSVERGGRDIYRVRVGRWQEARLHARTTGWGFAQACLESDTRLRVIDAAGRLLAENDDRHPNNLCSEILLEGADALVEGEYYIEVSPGGNAASAPFYILEVELL